MTVDIAFTDHEKELLELWADSTIHGGHYGDGDAVFPDEQLVLNKLREKARPRVRWTRRNLEIILIWAEHAVGGLRPGKEALNIDESRLLEKIRRTLDESAPD